MCRDEIKIICKIHYLLVKQDVSKCKLFNNVVRSLPVRKCLLCSGCIITDYKGNMR